MDSNKVDVSTHELCQKYQSILKSYYKDAEIVWYLPLSGYPEVRFNATRIEFDDPIVFDMRPSLAPASANVMAVTPFKNEFGVFDIVQPEGLCLYVITGIYKALPLYVKTIFKEVETGEIIEAGVMNQNIMEPAIPKNLKADTLYEMDIEYSFDVGQGLNSDDYKTKIGTFTFKFNDVDPTIEPRYYYCGYSSIGGLGTQQHGFTPSCPIGTDIEPMPVQEAQDFVYQGISVIGGPDGETYYVNNEYMLSTHNSDYLIDPIMPYATINQLNGLWATAETFMVYDYPTGPGDDGLVSSMSQWQIDSKSIHRPPLTWYVHPLPLKRTSFSWVPYWVFDWMKKTEHWTYTPKDSAWPNITSSIAIAIGLYGQCVIQESRNGHLYDAKTMKRISPEMPIGTLDANVIPIPPGFDIPKPHLK